MHPLLVASHPISVTRHGGVSLVDLGPVAGELVIVAVGYLVGGGNTSVAQVVGLLPVHADLGSVDA